MAIVKVKDNNQWIIPRTYVRIGGVWVPAMTSIKGNGFWDAELVIYVTANTNNLNVATLFNAIYPGSWTRTIKKRLIINSGVVIGSTLQSTIPNPLTTSALIIRDFPTGDIIIQNYGSIQGSGGLFPIGGSSGAQGGTAIYTTGPITIDNYGTIYGGGGSGGRGGRGGTGNGGTPGGEGGFGGRGQGYTQTSLPGLAGSPGSNGSGTGGTGGSGGTWGQSGITGSVGTNGTTGIASSLLAGRAPGASGYYLERSNVGSFNVSWINTGTRLGGQL